MSISTSWSGIIEELGYDLDSPHLKGTPGRVDKFMKSWHTNDAEPPRMTCFPNEPPVDQIIAVGHIRFYALCAHHGLPFFGEVAIGYLPDKHLLGLSKFARIVDHYAHRFTVQEELTAHVAEHLVMHPTLRPLAVGVVCRAEHLCMSMRGVERPGHQTVTSVMRGVFRDNASARSELLEMI